MKRDHPCRADCPDRSATCRLSCDAWKEYAEKRDAEYKKHDQEQVYNSYTIDRIYTIRKKIARKK